MKFKNSHGVMVEAPADLPVIVATAWDGAIVWSRNGDLHRVRYCLRMAEFFKDGSDDEAKCALSEFSDCIYHYAECHRLLDDLRTEPWILDHRSRMVAIYRGPRQECLSGIENQPNTIYCRVWSEQDASDDPDLETRTREEAQRIHNALTG